MVDERLLIGFRTADDAGVFGLDDETALVQTVDVITPIVDDPADFGYIAAVNALSDIFAMGAAPLTAMAFFAFEVCRLPLDAASMIFSGAMDALNQSACTLVGGHTLEDPQIKFGLSVTGTVHPQGVVTNSGAREKDIIYLTKPLGTGIASTAIKAEIIPDKLKSESTLWMKTSNGPASSAMIEVGVSAATDVTGFGLLGHLWEMCQGAGLGADVFIDAIPLMTEIPDLVNLGMVPAGAYRNRDHLRDAVVSIELTESQFLPLFDPQTSGGLLISVAPERTEDLEQAMEETDVSCWRIGMFRKGKGITIKTGNQ
jgi:selenide,water dikinase